MTMRRMLIFAGVLLIFFLALYSWNRRTRVLDELAANVGLELSGAILAPIRAVQDMAGSFWTRYIDLVNVREENLRLKARLNELEARELAYGEQLAELKRLRALVQVPIDVRWRPLAARVLAGRLGPNAVLDSITISRGYVTGARPGTPLVTHNGLVGRVLRSSAHASTALLITDPGSRVAVFGQETRAPGILKGKGMGNELEVDFVQRDASMKPGELLVTSGLDNKFPKGLPVGRVTKVAPSDYTQFMAVNASPLVDLQHLEEILLLEKSGEELPPEEPDGPPPVFVGPPLPPHLARLRAVVQPEPKPGSVPQPVVKQPAGQPASGIGPSGITDSPSVESRQPQNAPEISSPLPRKTPEPAPGRQVPLTREGAPRYRIITP